MIRNTARGYAPGAGSPTPTLLKRPIGKSLVRWGGARVAGRDYLGEIRPCCANYVSYGASQAREKAGEPRHGDTSDQRSVGARSFGEGEFGGHVAGSVCK